jgi:hypothetical protein
MVENSISMVLYSLHIPVLHDERPTYDFQGYEIKTINSLSRNRSQLKRKILRGTQLLPFEWD